VPITEFPFFFFLSLRGCWMEVLSNQFIVWVSFVVMQAGSFVYALFELWDLL
jgi:hypothetical protein